MLIKCSVFPFPQSHRSTSVASLNGMPSALSVSNVRPDGPLNSEGSSADQESRLVSSSAVFEAFTVANRAIENMERLSTATASSNVSQSSVALPSGFYSTPRVGTSHYGSNYAIIMERLAGGGNDVGGRWTIDEHYRRLMRMNSIPSDPGRWNATQVKFSFVFSSPFFCYQRDHKFCLFVSFANPCPGGDVDKLGFEAIQTGK